MGYVSPTTRSAGYVAGATQWNEFVMDHRWVNESTTDGRPMCWAYRIADIVPNGTGIVHTREGPTPLGGIFDAGQTVGANVRLSAGQYCEIVAYHSAGNNLDLLGTALWGAWVSFEWVRTL
jgi:hypothetical protein